MGQLFIPKGTGNLKRGVCWMEHSELEYEADIWWFMSTTKPSNISFIVQL